MSKKGQRFFASAGLLALGLVAGVMIANAGSAVAGAGQEARPAVNAPGAALDEVIPQGAFVRVAEQVQPALVFIQTEQTVEGFSVGQVPEFFRRFFDEESAPRDDQPEDQVQLLEGSGFIISPSGYIVTNGHVVAQADIDAREVIEADTVTVRLASEDEFEAEIVGVDIGTDLAVLKIDTGYDLPHIPFGDSDNARVGEWVLALGAPFGLTNTVSAGIISAKGRGSIRGLGGTSYRDFIQTDAAINRGNSGGPLVNLRGEVIGINTAIMSNAFQGQFAGVGFAIPMDLVSGVVDQLIEHGRTIRGWLGISMRPLNPLTAEGYGLEPRELRGAVLISTVNEGEPANLAGVQQEDIVVGIGELLDGDQDFLQRIAVTQPSESITLDIIRLDDDFRPETLHIEVTLGERPSEVDVLADRRLRAPQPGRTRRDRARTSDLGRRLGMTVAEIDERWARDLDWDIDAGGIVVTGVTQGSAAFRVGLRRGMIIQQVNRRPVESVDDFERLMEQFEPGDVAVLRVRDPRGTSAIVPLEIPDGR